YFIILMPVFIVLAIVGIFVNIIQVGFLFTGEPLKPKMEKINPIEGTKRLFSKKSAETLLRVILKIIVVGWIGYSSLRGLMGNIMNMAGSSASQIISFTGKQKSNLNYIHKNSNNCQNYKYRHKYNKIFQYQVKK
ncbi:MAG TPA: hypothetical protein ENH82_13355, partial [bacterium]|nr:hypothetical protein [bacterium]